jgi:hypothetical protein
MNARRTFFVAAFAWGAGVPIVVVKAQTTAQTRVDDKDPQAIALGYVSDSAKADKSKYPNHTVQQRCQTCQLFSGKPTDITASCAVFSGKHVAAIGWCSAYAKKAA